MNPSYFAPDRNRIGHGIEQQAEFVAFDEGDRKVDLIRFADHGKQVRKKGILPIELYRARSAPILS